MRTVLRASALVALVVLVAACAGGPVRSGASSPTPGGVGALDHATGHGDVLLRYDERGGFVGPGFFVSQAPIFTLYGDGTVIFRDPMQDPLPAVDGVAPNRAFRTARLSEEQIQSTLVMAIEAGGLGIARIEYRNDQVADASTAIFTLNAAGHEKTVSVYALGLDVPGMPDALARAAFARLAVRLGDFDQGGSIPTREYAPERYRGILFDGQPGQPGQARAKPWSWTDLRPSDFVAPANRSEPEVPVHILSVAQVEALGIAPYRGGFQGLELIGPDTTTPYSLAVRPLLPDDTK
jgi:hypothetical protein